MAVMTVPLEPQQIHTISELAEDVRPVSSLGNTFFLVANESIDPALMKISQSYITHYDMGGSFKNASEGKTVMCEAEPFMEYAIRLSGHSYENI